MEQTQELERFFALNEQLIADGLMSEDMLGGKPYEEIEVPTVWELYAEFRLTQDMNDLYCFALDDDNPRYRDTPPPDRALVHPIALVQLGTRPVLRQFPCVVPEGESSLHAKMECEFLRPAVVGMLYREEGRLAEKYARRGRRYLMTEGRFRDEDGLETLRYRHVRMVGSER